MNSERADAALARVDRLVRELVDAGLERISSDTIEEVRELARTVHQARLVRLERELAAMATVGERFLARDPSFTFGSWVAASTKVDRLARAARRILAEPDHPDTDEILGVLRRTYTPVAGSLVVYPLGAAGWVADSGFCGITVHLWDPRHRRLLQATLARPVTLVGDDPRRLLFQAVSEVTMLTVHELAHGAWALDDVRLSSDGRLSLHSQLQAVPAPPIGRRAYEAYAVTGAAEILDRLADRELAPLDSGAPVHVLVDVAAIREVSIDETAARASAEIVDRTGAVLQVSVPLRAQHDLLVDNLYRLERATPAAIFGRVYLAGAGVGIEPYTAIFDAPVALALRRGREVQEVHLALEPLPGAVEVPHHRRTATSSASPATRELRRGADAVQQVVERLYGIGLAAVQPGIVSELDALAAGWGAAGVPGAEARLRALARSSGTPEAHPALFALAEWLRLFRSGVALEAARSALDTAEARPAERRGEDLTIRPLGAELRGARLVIHGLDAAGGYVVLEDELLGVDALDPLRSTAPSRLFQDAIRLGDVLERAVELRDHPVARAPGRSVVRPAFHTAARSADRVSASLPEALRASSGAPFRVRGWAARDPAGWTLHLPGLDPAPVDDPRLQLDLEKRSADPDALRFDVIAVMRRDRLVVLSIDGRFPTLDPRATRWPLDRLQRRASAALRPWVDGLVGSAPTLPAADLDLAALNLRVPALREAVGRGGVLPPAAELWALGAAFARALGRSGPPIAALELPRERLWLAAAAPVAGWLRGDPDDRALDGLVLAVGAGLGDVLTGP